MADHTRIGRQLGKIILVFEQLRKFRDDTTGAGITIKCLQALLTDLEDDFDDDATDRFIWESFLAWFRETTLSMNSCVERLINGPFAVWLAQFVRGNIDSPAQDPQEILRDLYEQMLKDGKDVQENTITISAVAADADNRGNGTVLVSEIEPFEKRDNERIITQKFRAVCIRDALQDGVEEGSEIFELQGTVEGGGPIITVPYAEGYGPGTNRIQNGGFETWADPAAAPTGWVKLSTETYGTQIVREQTGGQVGRGTNSLKLLGDGVLATVGVKQLEASFASFAATQRIKPKTMYLISAYVKTDGMAAKTFTIEPKGTGFTAGATEKIELVNPGVTAYTLRTALWMTPKDIPADITLEMAITGTPAASDIVRIEDVTLTEMYFWPEAAIWVALVRGRTKDFAALPQQDYFTWDATNSFASLFQSFLTRRTNFNQSDIRKMPDISRSLPSAAAASADYAEALAT